MKIVVIDQGWAWGAPVGGFIANFIVGGLAKSYGIIGVATQELLNAKAQLIMLTAGLIYTFMYCFSLIGIFLCQKYGGRKIVSIGCFGTIIGFICAFFAYSVIFWLFSIGVIVGLSLSLIYAPLFVIVGCSFRKYVGVAMGISVAGVSTGQMFFPLIIDALITRYSMRGAYLVGAAILLHFLVTAVLLPDKIVETEAEKQKLLRELRIKANSKNKNVRNTNNVNNNSHKDTEDGLISDRSPVLQEDDKTKPDQLENNTNKNETTTVEEPKKKFKVKNLFSSFTRVQGVMLTTFIIAKVFADVGDVGISFALPLYADWDLNISSQKVSWAIALSGVTDLVSRVVVGIISDKPWCRHSLILLTAWLVEAITAFMFVLVPTTTGYFVFYGIFGMCSGTAITLMTVVITDFVGQNNLSVGFGLHMFIVGLFISFGQFSVGLIKDFSGTYDWSMYYLGLCLLLAFLFLSLEYPIKYLCFNTRKAIAVRSSPKKNGTKVVYRPNNDVDEEKKKLNIEKGDIVEVVPCDSATKARIRISSISSTLSNDLVEIVKNVP